jgi:hypothetical protein
VCGERVREAKRLLMHRGAEVLPIYHAVVEDISDKAMLPVRNPAECVANAVGVKVRLAQPPQPCRAHSPLARDDRGRPV